MFRKLFFAFFLYSIFSFGQEPTSNFSLDANYFYGSILQHNKDIFHLIKGHPEGLILGYSRKTYGENDWEQAFNYPDYGYSLLYQDSNYDVLGNALGLYGHYNFYFLKRNIMLRLATGISYMTNPYDEDTNFKNNAYGSSLSGSSYIMLNYTKRNIFKGFGIQAGFTLVHYSNASFKSPNSSTNSITANLGMTYEIDADTPRNYTKKDSLPKITEPIHFNFVLRGGINESDYIGLGQRPFWIVSAYADKRLGRKSSIQLGAEYFNSKFLETQIDYEAVAFPGNNSTGEEDYRRVGVFVGHELHINRLSLLTQLGYYVYYPYKFEGRVYLRPGLKYYFTKKIFGAITLKTHAAKAEAVEFGVGIRI